MRMSRRMGLFNSGITNLTNTSLLFNEIVRIPQSLLTKEFGINFYSGNEGEYHTSLGIDYSPMAYYFTYDGEVAYYIYKTSDTHLWHSELYKSLRITGGSDATNAELITWLQANATRTA